ncbi:MAG TPA: hypothetical protein VJK04_04030 [Candidatus Paceibacterota bacterium]
MIFEIFPVHAAVILICIEVIIAYAVNILSSTLYLHRYLAHRSIWYMDPRIIHVFRFTVWICTGMMQRVWVGLHRIHHAYTDEQGDPHSPWIYGIWYIGFFQAVRYHFASIELKDQIKIVTKDILPEKWDKLYDRHHLLGIITLFVICCSTCFYSPWGPLWGFLPGIITWLLHVLVVPIAGGAVNGLGHWQKDDPLDRSKNVVERDYLVGGELLHRNHHKHPWSARFEHILGQLDLGWRLLQFLGRHGFVKGLVHHDGQGHKVVDFAD